MLWKRIKDRVRRELFGPPPPDPNWKFMARNSAFDAYQIGDWTYGHPFVDYWRPGRKLTIGRFSSIGPEAVILLGGNHLMDTVSTYPFKEWMGGDEALPTMECSRGDVTIGNDVWVGRAAMILSGVTIGDGAVVGAGAVVARDIAPYSVVVGNPARHVRYRIDEALIPAMLRLAWWDWPDDRVRAAQRDLHSTDVAAFLRKYAAASDAASPANDRPVS